MEPPELWFPIDKWQSCGYDDDDDMCEDEYSLPDEKELTDSAAEDDDDEEEEKDACYATADKTKRGGDLAASSTTSGQENYFFYWFDVFFKQTGKPIDEATLPLQSVRSRYGDDHDAPLCSQAVHMRLATVLEPRLAAMEDVLLMMKKFTRDWWCVRVEKLESGSIGLKPDQRQLPKQWGLFNEEYGEWHGCQTFCKTSNEVFDPLLCEKTEAAARKFYFNLLDQNAVWESAVYVNNVCNVPLLSTEETANKGISSADTLDDVPTLCFFCQDVFASACWSPNERLVVKCACNKKYAVCFVCEVLLRQYALFSTIRHTYKTMSLRKFPDLPFAFCCSKKRAFLRHHVFARNVLRVYARPCCSFSVDFFLQTGAIKPSLAAVESVVESARSDVDQLKNLIKFRIDHFFTQKFTGSGKKTVYQ